MTATRVTRGARWLRLRRAPAPPEQEQEQERGLEPETARTANRRRPLGIVAVMVVGAALLMPLYAINALGSVDQQVFQNWDHFSESLVLAKIETTTSAAAAPVSPDVGLYLAQPDPEGPWQTFDAMRHGGASTSTGYAPYPTQLGLQGFLFTGIYQAHLCSSASCLQTVSAGLTALAVIGFTLALGLIAPRSFPIVFLLTSIASPWMTSAAKNLYWVPWSFFLPAIAAVFFVRAKGRRHRLIAGGAVFALLALRFGMGFEFLTVIAIFAAGIPLLAHVFGRGGYLRWRAAVTDAAIVFGLSIAAFLFDLVFTSFIGGGGDPITGLGYVIQHAATRTYGGTSPDPVTALSLRISPLAVLEIYTLGWTTDVARIGWGAPFDIVLGPHSVFPFIAACVVIIGWRLYRRDRRWARDLTVLLTGLLAPISWVILAKAHAFVHQPINFVTFYLLGVTSFIWIVVAWAMDEIPRVLRRATSARDPIPVARAAPPRADAVATRAGAAADHANEPAQPATVTAGADGGPRASRPTWRSR